MHLINRKAFIFLITIMLFTINTSFIFCFYIKNALAGDITHSEYTSILTVGTEDVHPPTSSSNNSPITKTTTDDNGNTVSDITRVTTTQNEPVRLKRFDLLQRFIDHFPCLARLIYLFSTKKSRGGN